MQSLLNDFDEKIFNDSDQVDLNKNKNYWREIYKKCWVEGANRVKIIQDIILDYIPGVKITDGFMCKSNQMLLNNPQEHIKGEPDFFVYNDNVKLFNAEVTGSSISIKNAELWVRPDKVRWAINNPSVKTYCFFVFNDKILFLELTVNLLKYPEEIKNLKGFDERYLIIPQNVANRIENICTMVDKNV